VDFNEFPQILGYFWPKVAKNKGKDKFYQILDFHYGKFLFFGKKKKFSSKNVKFCCFSLRMSLY
jgi:hypothetical protein